MGTRLYNPADFEAVFAVIDAATQANRTWREDPVQLRNQLADSSDPSGCILALDDGDRLTGVITWQCTGTDYLIEGWVHPEHCGKGAGTALLNAVEHQGRQRFKRATISTRTLADVPGVESLFSSQGYKIARRFYVMTTPLVGRTFEAVLPAGISFRPFAPEDLETLVAADNAIFADHWGSHPHTAEEWTRRYTVERPHDPTLWVIAWDDHNIVGECLGFPSVMGGAQDGWLAVVGVRMEWRGCGLGSAVLAHGFLRLQRAGFVTALLRVDCVNTAAIALYLEI